ncbi:5440_t:CDS:1, partial [Dentiscutata heterogama]
YSDTDSIFVSRNPYFTNQTIYRYKERLLDKNNSLDEFKKIFFNLINDMFFESFTRFKDFEKEINTWMKEENPHIVIEFEKSGLPIFYQAKKKYAMLKYTEPKYYFDNSWIDIEDKQIETDEYILLSQCKKFDNLLLKGVDIVRRNSTKIYRIFMKKLLYTLFDLNKYIEYIYELKFINIEQYYIFINGQDEKNIWMKHVFENITEEFIKYLYQKEMELDMELFEMTGRNNTENDDEEISIIEITQTSAFKTNNWKYENGKIILYEKKQKINFKDINEDEECDSNCDSDEEENEEEYEYDEIDDGLVIKNRLAKFLKYNFDKGIIGYDKNDKL